MRNMASRLWNRYFTGRNSMVHFNTSIGSEEPDSRIKTSRLVEHVENQASPPPKKAKLAFSRIWTWNVLCTMLAHFITAGHIAALTYRWAIFLSPPVEESSHQHPPFYSSRGLGMQPRDVGIAMSTLGAIGPTDGGLSRVKRSIWDATNLEVSPVRLSHHLCPSSIPSSR